MTTKLNIKRIAMLAKLLPDGVRWGDPITPKIVNDIVMASMEQVASEMVANYVKELPQ